MEKSKGRAQFVSRRQRDRTSEIGGPKKLLQIYKSDIYAEKMNIFSGREE